MPVCSGTKASAAARRVSQPEDIRGQHRWAFRRGLRELGYVEGQNIALEVRSAEGDYRRLPVLAAELVSLKPDVIVTNSEPAIRAVKEVAGTIPIVMSIVGDAVALGFAQSLAHPGGNLTGQTILSTDVIGKRLQMLHEIVPDPRLRRGAGRSRRQLRQRVRRRLECRCC